MELVLGIGKLSLSEVLPPTACPGGFSAHLPWCPRTDLFGPSLLFSQPHPPVITIRDWDIAEGWRTPRSMGVGMTTAIPALGGQPQGFQRETQWE